MELNEVFNPLEKKELEFKFIPNAVVKVNDDGSIRFKLITSDLDRHGQVTMPKGVRLQNFKANPIWLWAHNMEKWGGILRPPIGRVNTKTIEVTENELLTDVIFDEENDPFAALIASKHRNKFLSASSPGFIPIVISKDKMKKGQTGATHLEFELLEGSSCPVPANPKALQVKEWFEYLEKCEELKVDTKGFEYWLKAFDWTEEEIKDAMPDQDKIIVGIDGFGDAKDTGTKAYPLAPEATKWSFSAADGNAILGSPSDWKRYQKVHTWFDETNVEKKSSYKLPHHKLINGDIKTIWNGVKACMGALLGARGGIKIPSDERKKAYDDLARHYKEFDKPVPTFKDYDDQDLQALFYDVWDEVDKIINGDTVTLTGPFNPEMIVAEIRQRSIHLVQRMAEDGIKLSIEKKPLVNEAIEALQKIWPDEETDDKDELIKLLQDTHDGLKTTINPKTDEPENDELINSLKETIDKLKN